MAVVRELAVWVISDEMRATAAAIVRQEAREKLVADALGVIVFHFRDPDDDWGGTMLSSLEMDFLFQMVDANRGRDVTREDSLTLLRCLKEGGC